MRQAFPSSSITGSDFLPDVVARLRSASQETVAEIDITANSLPSKFYDAVVALNVFEHIEDHEKAAREVFRILSRAVSFIWKSPAAPSFTTVTMQA
jgi:2-polyprenyl-3-methyl-5-hydroxy-6-metoxy-1,4-benzoquinol methylase